MDGSDLCKEKGTERGAVNMIGFISNLVISLIPVFILYVLDKLFDLKTKLMKRFKNTKSYRNTIGAVGLLSLAIAGVSTYFAGFEATNHPWAVLFLLIYLLPAASPEERKQ